MPVYLTSSFIAGNPSMVQGVMLFILLKLKQTLIVTLSFLLLMFHSSSHGTRHSRKLRMEFAIVILHMFV